jgi:hypothetical protein
VPRNSRGTFPQKEHFYSSLATNFRPLPFLIQRHQSHRIIMAKNSKPKKSSRGKRSNRRKDDNSGPATADSLPASLDNAEKLVGQGSVAMDLGKPMAALEIFKAAALMYTKLQKVQEEQLAVSSWQLPILLAKTKCQTGEAHASMGNVDSAKEEFTQGLLTLDNHSKSTAKSDDGALKSGDDNATMKLKALQQREEMHDVRASLYMYLAQISDGSEAMTMFENGATELGKRLEILQQLKEHVPGTPAPMEEDETQKENDDQDSILSSTPAPDEAISDAKTRICEMHCAIAELYMTDMCMEDNAEVQCEAAIQKALQHCDGAEDGDFTNAPLEVLQTMANLRLSQSRLDDGTQAILAAYQKMQTGCQALASMVGFGEEEDEMEDPTSEEAQELMNTEEALQLPGHEFRVQTAKLLLECANSLILPPSDTNTSLAEGDTEADASAKKLGNQCAEAALQVLGSILAENDEVIEVWYLLGSAAMASCPPSPDMAMHHWSRALEMLEACLQQMEDSDGAGMMVEEEGDGRDEEIEMMQNQLADVKQRITEIEHLVGEEEDE